MPFAPVLVDVAAPVPVLAAGGIADGRSLAAVPALGAAGAVIGTPFQATVEALVDPAIASAIVDGNAEDTERSTVLDVVRGSRWPTRYTARTLAHPYLDRWPRSGARRRPSGPGVLGRRGPGRHPADAHLGREAVDLVTDRPAAEGLVSALVDRAEEALARAGRPS